MHLTADTLKDLPRQQRVNLINSLSGFKSANLLGTRAANGQENLSIVSSCFHLGADPALLGMIIRPHSVDRHSLEYLMETGFYTLNQVHGDMVPAAHQTAARYPRDVSEFTATGLTPAYLPDFPAPFVEQARIRLGMVLLETHTLQVNDTVMVIGAIEHIQLPGYALGSDGYVDIEKAGTVALSGLDSYHLTHRQARWSYAKPDQPLRRLDPDHDHG
ncbi:MULTISPECIES: flavin reductase [unclassified Alcanivorax]|jgi:flavin reductase (DIM6/NTAB) family NADH-FMN oxidoreductase RutF|uniref:flavin reductase family protein n=1 Tax=unclassified Alcanivorax TaxID=2638842 RepID=UPI0008A00A0E|nr:MULTISPECIES: flavin reductase [unclassified Alcanivorax]MBU84382.1 flavin oxidoreductase [Alcanivorax sp.]MEE3387992.1 flavin reductase [Pseudomonadota bacterium]SEF75220.1 NADH-FMN oxidoreductase RutF, flavin reductase (DIM6/NTAB) family [Alcanivorax sp. DSM 26293]